MKHAFLIIAAASLFATSVQAQVFVSSGYNNGSQAYDFSNAETVTNDANGVGYVANANGEFYHYGPASGTITINGLYNAYNPAVAGFTATPATPGVDYFRGLDGLQATAQEIAGNTAPRFGILKLDNGTNQINITNTNGAEVGLRTDFTNGITTTIRTNSSTGALRFLDDAAYTNSVLGDAQYVNGYVGKIGNDAFTFPVGNQAGNDLRTLAISAPAAATDHISVAYWTGDAATALDPTGGAHPRTALSTTPLNGETLVSVSPIGFWDWIPVAGTSNVAITVSLPANTGIGGYANASTIRLVGWNTSTSQWDLLGNTPASSTAEGASLSGNTGAYAGNNMSNYSAIGWGSISQTPLPVDLLSFTAQAKECKVQLTWQTANERNAAYFAIERSGDGNQWNELASTKATGAVSGYDWSDLSPLEGKNYYRLRIVDVNSTYRYSSTVSATVQCHLPQITVHPNPSTSLFQVSGLGGECILDVYNAEGQLVYHTKSQGAALVSIPVATWMSGSYLLRIVRDGKAVYTQQLTKF